MSNADILVLALLRAFPTLQPGSASRLAAELRAGEVGFGEGELKLERSFEFTPADAEAYLSGMGGWQPQLLASIDPRIRSLRWAPEHNFLYVSRVA